MFPLAVSEASLERFFLSHEPPSLAKPRAIALRKPLRFSFVPPSEPPPRMSSWIGDMVGISGVVAFYVFLDLCSKIREKSTFSTHPIHALALIRGSFSSRPSSSGNVPLLSGRHVFGMDASRIHFSSLSCPWSWSTYHLQFS